MVLDVLVMETTQSHPLASAIDLYPLQVLPSSSCLDKCELIPYVPSRYLTHHSILYQDEYIMISLCCGDVIGLNEYVFDTIIHRHSIWDFIVLGICKVLDPLCS